MNERMGSGTSKPGTIARPGSRALAVWALAGLMLLSGGHSLAARQVEHGTAADEAEKLLDDGRAEQAFERYRTAIRLAVEQGDREAARTYAAMLGEHLRRSGPERDGTHLEQPLADAEAAGDAAVQAAFQRWQKALEKAKRVADAGNRQPSPTTSPKAALKAAERALDIAERHFGPDHRLTVETTLTLARSYLANGAPAGAETVLKMARDKARRGLGEAHPLLADIELSLARLYERGGRIEQAVKQVEDAHAILVRTFGPLHPRSIAAAGRQAKLMARLGRYAEGAALLEETCERVASRYGTWHKQTAQCLERLGILLGRGGDLTGARDVYRRVLESRRGLLGPTAAPTLRTRVDLATLDQRQGRYEQAVARLKDVLAASGDAAAGPRAAVALDAKEALARTYYHLGQIEAAMPLAREVHAARVAAGDASGPLALEALNLIAGLHMRAGRLLEAQTAWEEVLSGYESLYGRRALATLTVMSNLGVVLEKQGLYERAEPLLRSAMKISDERLGTAHPQTLKAMNNLALLYESQGNFARAEPLYRLPIEVLGSTLGATHPDTIAVKNNLAFLFMMQQKYARAADMFEQVHSAWVQALGAEHQDTLKGLNNLGRANLARGRLDAAEQNIRSALAARRSTLGQYHVDTLRSMLDLGRVFLARGAHREAEQQLRRTLALMEQVLGSEHPYTFETQNGLAEALEAQGRVQDAYEQRETIFERRTRFFDRVLWVTNENAREGYLRLHRPELDAYLGLLPALADDVAARALLEVSLKRKGLLLRIASQVRQIASLGKDPELSELARSLTRAREALASRTLAGPGGESSEAHLEHIRELEFRVENLEGKLGRASQLYRESIMATSIDDLASAMPEPGALVDYFVYTRKDGRRGLMAAVLVHAQAGRRMELLTWDDLGAIEDAIRKFRSVIQDVSASDAEVLKVAQRTWKLLWQPVAAHLPADAPVYVVPDGLLNILPFDALADADGQYLVETTDLRMLTSARDLLPSEIGNADGPYVVMGGPDFETEAAAGKDNLENARARRTARRTVYAEATASGDNAAAEEAEQASASARGSTRASRLAARRNISLADVDARSGAAYASLRAASMGLRGLEFAPLPGAELEGRLVSQQVREKGLVSAMYARGEAQERVLAGLDEPPRVLHLATHGFFLEASETLRKRLQKARRSLEVQAPPPGDNPLLRAGLAFAGANANAPYLGELDTSNDGVLTALEVLGLNLTGTKLAVLSACETALGEVHEGEGIYGLRRSFQQAGVDEVVASLWEVSDAGTQRLMAGMYSGMLEGMAPRAALRQAQRELMRDPRWGYPYIWAAFTIVGQ